MLKKILITLGLPENHVFFQNQYVQKYLLIDQEVSIDKNEYDYRRTIIGMILVPTFILLPLNYIVPKNTADIITNLTPFVLQILYFLFFIYLNSIISLKYDNSIVNRDNPIIKRGVIFFILAFVLNFLLLISGKTGLVVLLVFYTLGLFIFFFGKRVSEVFKKSHPPSSPKQDMENQIKQEELPTLEVRLQYIGAYTGIVAAVLSCFVMGMIVYIFYELTGISPDPSTLFVYRSAYIFIMFLFLVKAISSIVKNISIIQATKKLNSVERTYGNINDDSIIQKDILTLQNIKFAQWKLIFTFLSLVLSLYLFGEWYSFGADIVKDFGYVYVIGIVVLFWIHVRYFLSKYKAIKELQNLHSSEENKIMNSSL